MNYDDDFGMQQRKWEIDKYEPVYYFQDNQRK